MKPNPSTPANEGGPIVAPEFASQSGALEARPSPRESPEMNVQFPIAPRKTGFNYESLPTREVRKLAQDHAAAIHELSRKTTATIIEIGRRLSEVKELL